MRRGQRGAVICSRRWVPPLQGTRGTGTRARRRPGGLRASGALEGARAGGDAGAQAGRGARHAAGGCTGEAGAPGQATGGGRDGDRARTTRSRACGFRSSSAGRRSATRRAHGEANCAPAIRSTRRCPKRGSLSVREGVRDLPASTVFVSYLRDGDRVLAFTVDRRGRLQRPRPWRVAGSRRCGARVSDAAHGAATAATAPAVWRLPDGRYRIALDGGTRGGPRERRERRSARS